MTSTLGQRGLAERAILTQLGRCLVGDLPRLRRDILTSDVAARGGRAIVKDYVRSDPLTVTSSSVVSLLSHNSHPRHYLNTPPTLAHNGGEVWK